MQNAGFFKIRRFYCSNKIGCQRALDDDWYSLAEYNQSQHKCIECQRELKEGEPLSASKAKWSIALILLVILSLFGYIYYRGTQPYPSNIIAIKDKIVTVKADSSVIPIVVEGSKGLTKKTLIKYSTVDGTALAGIDYAATKGTLIFDGSINNQQTILIPLLGNKDFDKNDKVLSLIFQNIENNPEVKIVIQPVTLSQTSISAAEALVSSLSISAENVGRYQKRKIYLKNLISNLKSDSIAQQMIQQYNINEENLIKQREKYYGLLKDLSQVEYRAALIAVDNRIASLERLGNVIQHNATMLMKQQFEQFAKTGIVEMDHWAKQLSDVVPDSNITPKDKNQGSSDLAT